ncbi:hypothetical protein J421_5068 (plasmid) [Gemmatirosa kalamazoonensis]|uniref:Uncharacterized protein n=1 Tax=Gemmatirosa kalamazoonensis TaxID=861299 RepID=W0RSP2_9BACT|nr:DUF6064 family protein [Gemmatirosa kalamazoonensis]AHG92603.1 hypothetical protein J421_5068 [Gemmatirosa kalamazoonensis]
MRLPFTTEQFLDVFGQYNETVWPAQWLLVTLAALGIAAALRGRPAASRVVSAVLAILWAWMGLAYHLAFFRAINPVGASLFAAFFVAQAALLAWSGVVRGRLTFRVRHDAAGLAGAALLVYALIVYPLLGSTLGHAYPEAPTFGLPCPTTIYTLGLLLWASPRAPLTVLVIPVLWALVGTSAALQLGMGEDFGLLAGAAITIVVHGVSVVGRHQSRADAAS